jgi:hypothetical protein
MSARKLGRFAGLVFVLAVVFGSVGAAAVHAEDHNVAVVQASTLITEWD